MKTIYKFLGILSIVSLILPVTSYAAPERENKKLQIGGMFCENIETLESKIETQISEKSGKFEGKKDVRIAKIDTRRDVRDEKRAQNRSEIDIKRDTKVDALMEKADNDAERTAVLNFEETLKDAVATRRSSVDSAVKIFRAGVDEILNNKFEGLDSSIPAFKSKVEQAIAKAKSDCANGVEDSVARESFKAVIKSAREEFSAFRGDEIKSQIKALAEARKTSIENAVNTFKATMEDARDDLKTAFGENN